MHSYNGEVGITYAPRMWCSGSRVEKPMCVKGVPQIPSWKITLGNEIRTSMNGVKFPRVLLGPTSHPNSLPSFSCANGAGHYQQLQSPSFEARCLQPIGGRYSRWLFFTLVDPKNMAIWSEICSDLQRKMAIWRNLKNHQVCIFFWMLQ